MMLGWGAYAVKKKMSGRGNTSAQEMATRALFPS